MSTTHDPGPALRQRSIHTLTPSELRVAHGDRGTGTIPAFLRRFVLAIVVAGAAALSVSAFGDLATADAAPEWDVTATTKCDNRADILWSQGKITDLVGAYRECCEKNGGVWSDNGNGTPECHAPAANAPGRPIPPGVIKPGVITQAPTPDLPFAPRGDITQTFTPAPWG
jgi:hypothetical protein